MGKTVTTKTMTCKLCLHSWVPRHDRVNICPSCKSHFFDIEAERLPEVKAIIQKIIDRESDE